MVGCPLAVAAVLFCTVQADRWIAPHLAVRTLFDCCRWDCRVTVQKERGNVADMRRRFKAVIDVLGAMIRSGVSLSRSAELTAQWDRILALGPLYLVTLDDLSMESGYGHWCLSSCCFQCSSSSQ